jgi:hypothetical protein
MEASMRAVILTAAAAFAISAPDAFAQTETSKQTETQKGYTGAYAPAGTPPTPYSTGPLPQIDNGSPGLDVAGPNGSTESVPAVPCGAAAHETDGSTTCVGIEKRR